MAYAGATAPTNFLLCNPMTSVSRTTYAELFAVIGTTFGAGDGSTTFGLPNVQARIFVGYKSGDATFGTLGTLQGSNTVNLAHSHTQNAHTHTVSGTTNASDNQTIYASSRVMTYGAHTHTFSGTTGTQSDGGTTSGLSITRSVNNPFIVVNFIIRYKIYPSKPTFIFNML